MDNDAYEIKIENIFEGPMDLLIYLIKKNEVDIYDIPIAIITDQYLSYLSWMKFMNIDFAGEFLVMAATLIQIKSKMLLPAQQEDDEEIEDPRLEIARPILEYLKIKSIANEMGKWDKLGEDNFTRKSNKEDSLIKTDDDFIQIDLFDLIFAFQSVLDKITPEQQFDFTTDKISINDRISEITDLLEEKGTIVFSELFNPVAEKKIIIVTFLAVLEMAKLNLIQIIQHIQNGQIRLLYL